MNMPGEPAFFVIDLIFAAHANSLLRITVAGGIGHRIGL
jgi:hypothetical protein